MRRLREWMLVLGSVIAACGGTVVEETHGSGGGATSTTSSGQGGSTATTTTGSGPSTTTGTGGSTTTGTGASTSSGTGASTTSGSTGAGGAPNLCESPQAAACSGPAQCVLATENCCICGTPEISEFIAVNSNYASTCSCNGPACGCATFPNPNLAASCQNGQCVGWDVRQVDAYSACTSSADCRLRAGLDCCEACSASDTGLVAIRADAEQALQAAMCAPNSGCVACAPQYPSDASAACIGGRCTIVITN